MTPRTVEAVGFALAVVAAARSTWSPCGISMLSTLTPLGERSRAHRYPVTVGWFVVGAAIGGAALGAAMAGLAATVAMWSPAPGTTELVVLAAVVVTVGSDLRLLGFTLPTVPRQVNEVWTGRYRRWAYAAGFGAQIGVGVSTYVMTAAVYLTIVLAAMTGHPLAGFLIGLSFGTVRGLAILLGARLSTPAAIRGFHRRFEAAARLSLMAAVFAQCEVACVAIGSAAAAVISGVLAAGVCGFELYNLCARHRLSRRLA